MRGHGWVWEFGSAAVRYVHAFRLLSEASYMKITVEWASFFSCRYPLLLFNVVIHEY